MMVMKNPRVKTPMRTYCKNFLIRVDCEGGCRTDINTFFRFGSCSLTRTGRGRAMIITSSKRVVPIGYQLIFGRKLDVNWTYSLKLKQVTVISERIVDCVPGAKTYHTTMEAG